jgi:16S rRNA (guanine527-N7)-methyltransferase
VSPKQTVQPVDVARDVYRAQFTLISRYVDILRSTGVERGLLGPREAERVWDRHILNSAALSGLISEGGSVADVGSGAGLPGVPLAILRSDLHLTLIEPLLRRYTFLTDTVEKLDLVERVEVARSRAEDHDRCYDVVVSRALAPLDRLVGWCNPLRASEGVILALKGRSAADEVAAAERQLEVAGLEAEVLVVRAHPDSEPATVVRVGARGVG